MTEETPHDVRLYRPLKASEAAYVKAVKQKTLELLNVFDNLPQGREVALARTNLEQAEMWAVRSITRAP
jgi:hypothetical protein